MHSERIPRRGESFESKLQISELHAAGQGEGVFADEGQLPSAEHRDLQRCFSRCSLLLSGGMRELPWESENYAVGKAGLSMQRKFKIAQNSPVTVNGKKVQQLEDQINEQLWLDQVTACCTRQPKHQHTAKQPVAQKTAHNQRKQMDRAARI